nr:hypothetical protein [Kibdelosporangium sp. MJ126-NF4]
MCAGDHGAHVLHPGVSAASLSFGPTGGPVSADIGEVDGETRGALVHSPDGADVLTRAEDDSGALLLTLLLFVFPLPLNDRVHGGYRQPGRRKHPPPIRAGHGRAFLLTVCVART